MVAREATGTSVLISSALLCAVLGSIHAFSVFLEPLEMAFGLRRSTVSLTYSFALVALTAAVLLGPRFYGRVSPAFLIVGVGIVGAVGAVLAGMAEGITGVWVGYSLCFGAANGVGYGFALQYSARANPRRPGLAMGVVTAAYALGAVASPILFETALDAGGVFWAMVALAGTLLVTALVSGWIVAQAGFAYGTSGGPSGTVPSQGRTVATIWLAYGASVATGLMVIGHAAELARLVGATPWMAPAVLASCNLLGSLAGGHFADRLPDRVLLSIFPLISLVALLAMVFFPGLTLLALAIIGFAYGGTIAAYPAVIATLFPGDRGPRVYGQVFTDWGLAGLLAPWAAGALFDQNQDYGAALLIAAALAALSAAIAGRGFR